YSAPYNQQTFMDAFSSKDLVEWKKHPRILDVADVTWAKRALWAPSIVEKDGWYYLFFGANDIQNDRQPGGIGVARARRPAVPTGAGHHSVLQSPSSGKWYIVYHRRPLGERDANHRVVCIDELRFDEKGQIVPVVITKDGVPRDPLPREAAR